jgi:hypothetical protein
MTLILTLANNEQTVVLADRRLTTDERPARTTNEEYNKLTSLVSDNGRAAVAFTGLATTPDGFSTADWILDALWEAADTNPGLQETIGKLPGRNKLTVVFAGYLYMEDGSSLPLLSWVSNFQGKEWNDRSSVAKPEFEGWWFAEERPNPRPEPFMYVRTFGATRLLENPASLRDAAVITRLLKQHKPMEAIRDKALDALNRVGASEGQPGPVGRRCGSIVVPSDFSRGFLTDYYSDRNRWEVELPNQIVRMGTENDYAIKGMAIGTDPTLAPPMTVRKVGRNQRCPCQSGQKYKYCHGRPIPRHIRSGGTFATPVGSGITRV